MAQFRLRQAGLVPTTSASHWCKFAVATALQGGRRATGWNLVAPNGNVMSWRFITTLAQADNFG